MQDKTEQLNALRARLDDIVNVRLKKHDGPVPPRLVRANSAFELQAVALRMEEMLESQKDSGPSK